jgi:hypothetical protein
MNLADWLLVAAGIIVVAWIAFEIYLKWNKKL